MSTCNVVAEVPAPKLPPQLSKKYRKQRRQFGCTTRIRCRHSWDRRILRTLSPMRWKRSMLTDAAPGSPIRCRFRWLRLFLRRTNLSAQVSADGVRISWTGPAPPEAPAGLSYRYRIMRKPVGAPAYVVLADVEPAATGSYLDKTFEWEQKYEYRITTLTQVDSHGINTAVEGDDSKPVEVFTRDIYPPAQPAGLQAVFSSVGQKPFIDLTWAPNLESDLAGYNVFRRVEGGAI